MAKIVTFFNHKGGVGKTTSSYNVAWGLSMAGKRVLMIDADPQCNLTEIAVESELLYGLDEEWSQPSLVDNVDSNFFIENNIYEYLVNYIQPIPEKPIPKIRTFQKQDASNLELLPGFVRFAELEKTIALSVANVPGLGHVPTSVYSAIKKIGVGFDYIIIDLSPALSATNQLLLMLSDYFIVPANPSIFSRQALMNLGDIFKSWNRELSGFEVFIKRIKPLPKMLGIICQNYRPYSRADEKNTKSAKRFEVMMSELNQRAETLAVDLSGFGMALTKNEFNDIFHNAVPYRIADIPDFNQLVVVSELEKIPVIAINNKILQKHEINTKQYREKVDDFIIQYDCIVKGLLKI